MSKPTISTEPNINVGIVHAHSISVRFNGRYVVSTLGQTVDGLHDFSLSDGKRVMMGDVDVTDARFEPEEGNTEATFCILNVQIGIGFHWDRREDQLFNGSLSFVVEGGMLWAVNTLGVESYLRSVISSEMSATSDLELLKAHAVTSRSWLMAQVWGKKEFHGLQKSVSDDEVVTWRDREDHTLFDVCADDHCQRYQGLCRVSNPNVDKAIADTRGLLLMYDGEVCDARFSKCCGGVTELFESCWSNDSHPYLQSFHDAMLPPEPRGLDLTTNEGANAWLTTSPDAFCNTSDPEVLTQVLNDYDQSTHDFFRWRVTLTAQEIAALLHTKGGYDLGTVTDLVPLQRGPSARITRLKIVGDKRTIIVGKELEIRRLLSPTHLYSSAFVVEKDEARGSFTLIGGGWGHGVGLCQIGAAVMARKGFSFRGILYHYFRRALIEKLWV